MKRNKFSLSNYKLFTGDMGKLIPCGLTQVLPGDTIQQSTSALIRLSPLLAPVMHPVHARIHHWFVPHRLIWEDFEDFITGGPDGQDASVLPTTSFGGGGTAPAVGSLADYLGVPTLLANGTGNISMLPFRGYALIWNEWYRDQDLQTELAISLASGADVTTSRSLQNVDWEKDYFTLARPWTQKGAEVTIPLGTAAPVVTTGDGIQVFREGSAGNSALQWDNATTNLFAIGAGAGTGNLRFGAQTGLETDLSTASSATINDLREAFALQQYAEARAIYGSRYVEYLRYYGVRSSDARLQRPEYLGGGKQTVQFSEVLQTGVTTDGDDTEGVGNLKGHGIGSLRSNRYRRYFEEHGYIFSLFSVKPKTMYADGLPRHWSYQTKEDFFQKELQHIGQQEILNKEVRLDHASPTGVFGYGDRYDELRRCESTIAGEFRTTLNFWHMARLFSSDPSLNAAFVSSNPTDRIYASTATDQLYVMANHSIQARRMVSSDGRPGMRIL